MEQRPLEHGIFLAPYHDIPESPTVALLRDLDLVEHLKGVDRAFAQWTERKDSKK